MTRAKYVLSKLEGLAPGKIHHEAYEVRKLIFLFFFSFVIFVSFVVRYFL